MADEKRTIRIGPLTVFVLVVVVCLAVMAVLSVATAHAARAESTAQASFADEAYDNDAAAARALQVIDETLAGDSVAGADALTAAAHAAQALPAEANAQAQGTQVAMAFAALGGRTLSVRIEVQDDLTYRIVEWTTGVDRDETQEEVRLWTGA